MPKSERQKIVLDRDDLIAGAEILTYIARPHRPDSALKVISAWLNSSEKPSRLYPKLDTLVKDLLNALEAARWLQTAILSRTANLGQIVLFDSGEKVAVSGFPGAWPMTSLRHSAAVKAGTYEGQGNAFRDVWSRRKPIIHLALAAALEIGKVHHSRSLQGFDINLVMTERSWIKPTLVQAEAWAVSAQTLSIIPAADLWHFMQSDSF